MFSCHSCQRQFPTSQSVKGHLKHCEKHKKAKGQPSRGQQAQGPPAPKPQPSGMCCPLPAEKIMPPHPMADLMNFMVKQTHDDDTTRLKQKRTALIAALCSEIDRYRPQEGVLTPEMAAAAKVALIDELGNFPIEDFSPMERSLRAEAVRNHVLAPHFRTQKEQLTQQEDQLERQEELRRQEMRQIKQEAATQARRVTRKATLMEIGIARARKALPSSSIVDPRVALFEWEVRERLDILLVGDETEQQAAEVIEAAIEGPLLEWNKRLEQARLATRQHIVNQCVTLAKPLVEAALPWVTATVIKKCRETFGVSPSPQPTAHSKQAAASSETPTPSSSQDGREPHPIRDTQPGLSTPPVNPDENVTTRESGISESQERQRAAS